MIKRVSVRKRLATARGHAKDWPLDQGLTGLLRRGNMPPGNSRRRLSVDAALEKRQVKRAYKIYAPAYDFVFDWIFHPGREQAIRLLDLRRGEHVLEVGIGSGLNQHLFPDLWRIPDSDLPVAMIGR